MLKKSFTLIELMIVLTVLALLTALAISFYPNVMEKMKVASISKVVKDVSEGFQRYKQDTGYSPIDMSAFFSYKNKCNNAGKYKVAGWDGPYLTSYSDKLYAASDLKSTFTADASDSNCTANDISTNEFNSGEASALKLGEVLSGTIQITKVDGSLYYSLVIGPTTQKVSADKFEFKRDGDVFNEKGEATTPSALDKPANTEQIRLLHGIEVGIDNSPKAGSNESSDTVRNTYTTGKMITLGILEDGNAKLDSELANGQHSTSDNVGRLATQKSKAVAIVPLDKK